jgi:ABC-2 type transport system ATP-binding protein
MVLEVEGLGHRYGQLAALHDVTLGVAAGECVALLGPNGAGKTTLVHAVIGLRAVQRGTVRVAAGDPRAAATRRRLGVVQQSVGFPRTLKVGELVRGAAVRLGLGPAVADPVLAEIGITDLAGRRAGKLSGGQQQRVQLAMALVGDPRLLVLDEPTIGLDASSRRAFWRTLAGRRDRGAGVLLTTHQIDEAAAVADRVIMLHCGRVMAADTPTALTSLLPDRTVTARTDLGDARLRAIAGEAVTRDGAHVRIATAAAERVVRALLAADPDLSDLRVEGAGLEEALLALVDGERPASRARGIAEEVHA